MWAEESVFYHIYPLGFCGCPQHNDFVSAAEHRLGKISAWLEHISSLGVNALYLGPVFEASAHGYDTADYLTVDRRLGTNDDLKELVRLCHQRGIRVVLDGVFNHVGRNFWAFADVRRNRENSPYCSWFKLNFDYDNRYHDGFCYEGWDGCDDLVKLNLRNPEVRRYLLDVVSRWIREFDIDGLRLDVAHYLYRRFLRELHNTCAGLKSDFWLMGEVLWGNYRRWVNPDMLQSVTNYECYKGLHSSCNDHNMFEIAYSLERQYAAPGGLYQGCNFYSFLENHDVSRIATLLRDERQLKPLYALLFTVPGIPALYYGGEWGVKGCRENSDAEVRPSLELLPDNDLTVHLRYWINLRRCSKVLAYGSYRQLALNSNLLAFVREYEGERLVIAVNIGDFPQNFELEGRTYTVNPFSAELCS